MAMPAPPPAAMPAPPPAMHQVECQGCHKKPIAGMLFKCANCADFNLCWTCDNDGAARKHTYDHVFLRINRPLPSNPTEPLLPNLYKKEKANAPARPTAAPQPSSAPSQVGPKRPDVFD